MEVAVRKRMAVIGNPVGAMSPIPELFPQL